MVDHTSELVAPVVLVEITIVLLHASGTMHSRLNDRTKSIGFAEVTWYVTNDEIRTRETSLPVHHANIAQIVLDAWNDARCDEVEGEHKRDRNRNRSAKWIDCLARRFQEHYQGGRYRLFWSYNSENQKQFGRNEMLFDIAVSGVSVTRSRQRQAQNLEFIAQCHWQVESEFSRTNTRDIVIDMSKLVMGSAENKLFVASHRSREEAEDEILNQCSEIAGRCIGRVYFCFVSHPDDWKTDRESLPALHEWVAGGWAEVAMPAAG